MNYIRSGAFHCRGYLGAAGTATTKSSAFYDATGTTWSFKPSVHAGPSARIGGGLTSAGRLAEVEQIYRAILRLDPTHFDALQFCGMIATQSGRTQDGERLIREALAAQATSGCSAQVNFAI
jgi:hypothetical protein